MSKPDLIKQLDEIVFKLHADYRMEDKAIAGVVLAAMERARLDVKANPCAYCDCMFPCAKARAGDIR